MKRITIGLLLLVVMLAGMMNVHAAPAQITVRVDASKTELQVGDTVEYTVLATGTGVVAMQFELRLPEGLRYIPNSGATPENLAQKLGVPSADWTESSMMFTFYNDIGITFAKGTEILRFSCVAEKAGEWTVDLYELLPFDGEFQEFIPQLQVQTIQVTTAGGQVIPSVPEETAPPVTETKPPVSIPTETDPTPIPDHTVPVTEPASIPEPTEQDGIIFQPDTEGPSQPEEAANPEQEQPPRELPEKNNLPWVILAVIAAVGICGAVIFFLVKKKDV